MTKREAIIQATIQVVAEQGIGDSPTIQIARRAGAAEFTLFRLFGNKNDLLAEAYREVTARFRTALSPIIDDLPTMEDKLRVLLSQGVAYYRSHPEELTYIQQYTNAPQGERDRPDILCEKGEDITDFLATSLLLRGRSEGFLKNLPLTALTGLFLAPAVMLLREEQIRGLRHSEETVSFMIETCLQSAKA